MSARTAIAERGIPTVSARVLTVVAVLGAHAVLLILLWVLRGGATEGERDEPTTVLLILPMAAPLPGPAPSSASRSPRSARNQRRDEKARGTEAAASAPVETNSAPVAIDWTHEAALAASRQIDADEAAARRAQAFSARKGRSLASAKPAAPKFGWSYAHTHRFETVPGGILFNLNDRCVILMTFMLMPICRIGKIEERGDLFEHMNDPVPLGELDAALP